MPQPYLVPVRPTFSRIAQSNGVSASTSTSNAFPLMVRLGIWSPQSGCSRFEPGSTLVKTSRGGVVTLASQRENAYSCNWIVEKFASDDGLEQPQLFSDLC